MTKILTAAVAAACLVTIGTAAVAQPYGHGYGYHRHHRDYRPMHRMHYDRHHR